MLDTWLVLSGAVMIALNVLAPLFGYVITFIDIFWWLKR